MDDARSRSTGIPTLRVRTSCEHTVALVERYARDFGPSGVFVRTRGDFELGAPVRFEYLLADGRCALAGEGRVVFGRSEGEAGAQAAGVGIAFDRLRQGDRAVVERMAALRGTTPSRFEQAGRGSRVSSVPPPPSLRAETLFADVKTPSADTQERMAAFLSADLTADLPTVRPPPGASTPGLAPRPSALAGRVASSVDLADQLEPVPERAWALDGADTDETPIFVPLEAPAAERRPPSNPPATEPERERRFAELMADASHEAPPRARMRVLLPVLVVLVVLALFELALTRGVLEPWLQR
jgi:Tfp pilus assembly protein PilZ